MSSPARLVNGAPESSAMSVVCDVYTTASRMKRLSSLTSSAGVVGTRVT